MLRLRALALLFFVAASSSCASPEEGARTSSSQIRGPRTLGGVRITNYILARESDLRGGGSLHASGLSRAHAVDFLCSGHGVAMQGTGIADDGVLVKYVSGGGGWCGGYARLCNCASARFAEVEHVFGSSGRALVKNFSVAVDTSVIPSGSSVWIGALRRWYRADDTGGGIVGRHIDVYTQDEHPHYYLDSDVVVSDAPHEPGDDGPNGEPADGSRTPAGGLEPEPRPEGGPFPALDVRHPVASGGFVTQCNEGGDGERVWQTRAGGRDPDSRWAEARYPQTPVASCGEARDGKHPIVLRSEPGGTLGATWITTCADEPGVAHVFQVEGDVDGHPAAPFHHDELDGSCSTR